MKMLAALHRIGGFPPPGFVPHPKRDRALGKQKECLKKIGLLLRFLKRVTQLDANGPTAKVEGVKVPLDRLPHVSRVDRVEDSSVVEKTGRRRTPA